MTTYTELANTSSSYGETNDCGVKAIAVTVGCTYEEAHRALAAQGRRPGRGVTMGQIKNAILELGGSWVPLFGDDLKEGEAKTVATAERALARKFPGTTFILNVRRHVAGFDGQIVQDWTRGRRNRVMQIIMVRAASAKAPEAPKRKTGAVAAVWAVCDEVHVNHPNLSTKDLRHLILTGCAALGLNANTAATQYNRWRKTKGF